MRVTQATKDSSNTRD